MSTKNNIANWSPELRVLFDKIRNDPRSFLERDGSIIYSVDIPKNNPMEIRCGWCLKKNKKSCWFSTITGQNQKGCLRIEFRLNIGNRLIGDNTKPLKRSKRSEKRRHFEQGYIDIYAKYPVPNDLFEIIKESHEFSYKQYVKNSG